MPTLIVVSGPMGSGKTTLAHKIAAAVGCSLEADTTDGYRPSFGQILSFDNAVG